ncbi:uncharacterized protein LOC118648847 [Monomorium pharaonis]|uniref:uncharacterized protein LOC118648847 n=2 Tax=Monomorium pharaonis TaxID=307658 RepID=UPI0017478008|nr:uncharacterized protein LOC118648847 [Monomorium pharaonis]
MSDSSSCDSNSDNDINNAVPKKVKRRYKTGLYKDYETHFRDNLSWVTRSKWDSFTSYEHQLAFVPESSNFSNLNNEQNRDCCIRSENNCDMRMNNNEASSNNSTAIRSPEYKPDLNIEDTFEYNEIIHINNEDEDKENEDASSVEDNSEDDDKHMSESSSNGYDSDNNEFDSDDYDANISDDETNGSFDDNTIMFEKTNLTIRDIMTLIMGFSIRFRLSDLGRQKLIELIKLIAGPEFKDINISKYRLQQRFDPPDDKINYHYYCNSCNKEILYSISKLNFKNYIKTCSKCDTNNKITLKSTNYFTSINLTYQLKMLFESPYIKQEIFNFINSVTVNQCNVDSTKIMRDVNDSKLYNKINNRNTCYLTYNISTDGAPLTNSGKRGFYPLSVQPNFVSPISRFKQILLCGILTCTKEPTSDIAQLFFSTFIDEAKLLYENGIEVTNLKNESIIVKFCPLAYCVDSVCRPILQNRMQFNGYYGCSWCYHPGCYVKEVSGIRYPLRDIDPELRSHESHLKDIKTVTLSNKRQERGVKGNTALIQIPCIDIVWSFSFDYLHTILFGIEQQLYNKWTCPKSQSMFKLRNADVKAIEKRLLSITPTQDIHRLPRSRKEKLKGAEVKTWILVYSLPCLEDILHDTALKHYSLLVRILYTLLKTTITEEELVQCEYDALKFVGYYQVYYGVESMTFNVHILLHVVQSVRQTGPLWNNSTFPFEGNIFQLKQLINGPNKIDQQIARKHLQQLHFKTGNVNYSSNIIKNYCTDIFRHKNLSTYFYCGEDVVFTGASYSKKIDGQYCRVFKKCIYNGKVFHSIKYTKVKRTNDTMIQLKSGHFGRIIDIIEKENKCYLALSKIVTFSEDPFIVTHIKKIRTEDFQNYKIVPITDVLSKIISVNINNLEFLCKLPNTFEIQ